MQPTRRFYAGMKGANKQLCNDVSTNLNPLLAVMYPLALYTSSVKSIGSCKL